MIEINLIQKRKKKKISTRVMGVDITQFNWKGILIAFGIWYAQDMFLGDHFMDKEQVIRNDIDQQNSILRKKRRELKKHSSLKEKLNAYERRIKTLQQRSEQVKLIMKNRTNPKKLLESIARSVPEDMWFDKLTITPQKEIIIKGYVEAYKSIGDFLNMVNESAFVGKSLSMTGSATKEEVLYGNRRRIEEFEIKGQIKTFDPWQSN